MTPRPSSAKPPEEKSVSLPTYHSCIRATGSNNCWKVAIYPQTVGLDDSLVRMFKWVWNPI